MKNIYLVLLVVIALAVFILGMALFIDQKRSSEVTQPQAETIQPQTEGSAGGAAGPPAAAPAVLSPATESATQP